VPPREAVRPERPIECFFDEPIKMLQPIANWAAIRLVHLSPLRRRLVDFVGRVWEGLSASADGGKKLVTVPL
jgi:hypothetical protein